MPPFPPGFILSQMEGENQFRKGKYYFFLMIVTNDRNRPLKQKKANSKSVNLVDNSRHEHNLRQRNKKNL